MLEPENVQRTWCETNTVNGPTSAKNPIYATECLVISRQNTPRTHLCNIINHAIDDLPLERLEHNRPIPRHKLCLSAPVHQLLRVLNNLSRPITFSPTALHLPIILSSHLPRPLTSLPLVHSASPPTSTTNQRVAELHRQRVASLAAKLYY